MAVVTAIRETVWMYTCPDCHTQFSVDRQLLNRVHCPSCGSFHSVTVKESR
jgi:transcription initiation factor IIE alpha subunit